MKNTVSGRGLCAFLVGFLAICTGTGVKAQTNPQPQLLPFSYQSVSGSALPAGVAVHGFGTSLPTARITFPGTNDLPYNAAPGAGGWLSAGVSGIDGIGLLASGAKAAGAVLLAVNTIGVDHVQVTWTARTVQQQDSRDNSLALQYRIGTTGDFIDLGDASLVYSTAGNSAGHSAVFSIVLPDYLGNESNLQLRWLYWESSEDVSGSRDRIALDDVSVKEIAPKPDHTPPSVMSFSPANRYLNVPLTSDFVIAFTENMQKGTGNINIINQSDNTVQAINVQTSNVVVAKNMVFIKGLSLSYSKAHAITIDPFALQDKAQNAFSGISDPAYWSFTTADPPGTPARISTIQGPGIALAGSYTIKAIVTAVYPGWSPAGYYVQEETADSDGNDATSEGLYVVQSGGQVQVGDLVQILGIVTEHAGAPSFGQAVMLPESVSVLSSLNPLPDAVSLMLPATSPTFFERYEGMLVKYDGRLTVTDHYDLGSYGSIRLSQGGLVYQPTQLVDPNDNDPSGTSATGVSNLSGVTALIQANRLRTIILDDGNASAPVSLPFINEDKSLRVGSTIDNLTGIMAYGYNNYRLQTLPADHPFSTSAHFSYSGRPADVPSVGAGLPVKVASFNVLNYFNGDGHGGGFPSGRGAYSISEFNRQRAKIIAALTRIDADVVGLTEIENDGVGGQSALADLVSGLNAEKGAGTYAFINDESVPNTDQIRCAIIYKPATVTPSGTIMTSANPVFSRPPVAQQFKLADGKAGHDFLYIINHFKSKGCSSATGLNKDQGDGQSCYNQNRREQSTALLQFIASTVIPASGNDRIISMGDYNAYYQEDPLDILRAGGYTVLGHTTSYSYLFSGQAGSLDHAVVSASLNPFVTGTEKWNINAAEPDYLAYKDGIDDAGSDQINPWAETYRPDQWRSSDHDPVLVGLNFKSSLPVTLTDFKAQFLDNKVLLLWSTTSETSNGYFTIERSRNGISFEELVTVDGAGNSTTGHSYAFTDHNPMNGISYYRLRQTDVDGVSTNSRIVSVVNEASYVNLSLFPNPVTTHLMIRPDLGGVLDTADYTCEITGANGWNVRVGQGGLDEINSSLNALLPGIKTGIYLIKLTNASGVHVFRILRL